MLGSYDFCECFEKKNYFIIMGPHRNSRWEFQFVTNRTPTMFSKIFMKDKKNSTPERARHLIYWWYILRLGILCCGHRWDCCSHTLLFYLSHQNLFDFIYQHPPYLQVSNSDFRSIISLHICSVIPRGNGWRDLIPYYFILAWQTSALNVTTSGMTTYSHLLYSL